MFHLDASVNLVETLLEVVDVAVECDEDVDLTGVGGGQNVVVVWIFRLGDRLRIPADDLSFREVLVERVAPTLDLPLWRLWAVAAQVVKGFSQNGFAPSQPVGGVLAVESHQHQPVPQASRVQNIGIYEGSERHRQHWLRLPTPPLKP